MPKITQRDQMADGVQAVVLAVQILENLAFGGKPSRITDLAAELGTSKNRIYRHLQTLVRLGYIIKDPDTERYRVGMRLARLGSAVGSEFNLLDISRPIMRKLRDTTGFTVVLSKVEGNHVYAIDQIDGSSFLTVGIVIGTSLDLHGSAQGKLVLAYGPDDLLRSVLRSSLVARTSRTVTDPDKLRADVDRIRGQGWAAAPGETMTGLNVLAAPIFDGTGALVATMALLGSVDQMTDEPTRDQIEAVTAAAKEFTANLG